MARILIVDDDPDMLKNVKVCLEAAGHEVFTAEGRSEGMELIAKEEPDLLVLDVMMEEPDDGISMSQELRRNGFKKPVIMLSSIDKVTGMSFGKDTQIAPVDEFLEKPVKPSVLIEKIGGLLSGKGGSR